MISPISSAAATAGVVVAHRLVTEKPVSARLIIGSGVYLFFLAAINESRPELASQFAFLVLIGVLFAYAPELFEKLGVAK
jgi:hypothetical protein